MTVLLVMQDILTRFHGSWLVTPETDASGQVVGCTAVLEQEVLPRGKLIAMSLCSCYHGLLNTISLAQMMDHQLLKQQMIGNCHHCRLADCCQHSLPLKKRKLHSFCCLIQSFCNCLCSSCCHNYPKAACNTGPIYMALSSSMLSVPSVIGPLCLCCCFRGPSLPGKCTGSGLSTAWRRHSVCTAHDTGHRVYPE